MFKACLAILLALPAGAHAAAAGDTRPADQSSVTVHAGAFGTNNGYADRYAVGVFGDFYAGALGIHTDIVSVDREENGTYGALGLSYRINDTFRPKLLVGTSTSNDSILPDLLVAASVIITPAKGWVIAPDVTYRDYGQTALTQRRRDYTQVGIAATRYFNLAGDTGGYYAAQGRVEISFSDTDKNPYRVSVGLQSVRTSGWRYGINAEAGYMAWDLQTGARDVRSNMWGAGASLGYCFKRGVELFVRAQHSHNDFYDTDGATFGVRVKL